MVGKWGLGPRKASPTTNVAGRGSGPHCPQAAGPRPRPRRFPCRGGMPELTLTEVARRVDVSPATLRRWVRDGIVPLANGHWTPAALAQARLRPGRRGRGGPVG